MKWRIKNWFPHLEAPKLQKLEAFAKLLARWNQKINLISPSTVDEMDRLHVADCVLGSQIIHSCLSNLSKLDTQPIQLRDLGSGNGFPGVVFAILYPEIGVEAVEVDQKKASFLVQAKLQLGLSNFSVTNGRIEDIKVSSELFAMTRAVGEVGKILDILPSQPGQSSHIFHFKGPLAQKEVGSLTTQQCSTWNIQALGTYFLPTQGENLDIQPAQGPEKREILLTEARF